MLKILFVFAINFLIFGSYSNPNSVNEIVYTNKLEKFIEANDFRHMYDFVHEMQGKNIKLEPKTKSTLEKKSKKLLEREIIKIRNAVEENKFGSKVLLIFSILPTPLTLWLIKNAFKIPNEENLLLASGMFFTQIISYCLARYADCTAEDAIIFKYVFLKRALGINYLIQNLETT